jgi:G3E family GTPase
VIKPNFGKRETGAKLDQQNMAIPCDDDSDCEAPDLITLIDDEESEIRSVVVSAAEGPPILVLPSNAIANDDDAIDSLPVCPVTILSGFLGSGKTTLIQYILKSPDHGKRIAVIENEFGEGLSVESMIARDGVDPQSNSLQDLIELPNGCICCTVKDSLVATLENLLDKRQDLDYILIEASGMANPGPIASVFWLDDALGSRLKLDGIVTLVDGVHILEQLESTEEAAQQIAYADRIVLNKLDLLEKQQDSGLESLRPKLSAVDVEGRLRRLNPTAPILRTSFSRIPMLGWILNADCFGGADRLEELEKAWNGLSEENSHSTHDHSRDCHHDHDHSHHVLECQESKHRLDDERQHIHTPSITTLALQQSGSVNVTKLNVWLADILWPNQDQTDQVLKAMLENTLEERSLKPLSNPKESKSNIQQIYRIKGIVSTFFRDEGRGDTKEREAYRLDGTGLDRRRFILQAVHDLWEVYPASDDLMFQSNEERVCKVIVIGKYLNEAELRSGFQSCFLNF